MTGERQSPLPRRRAQQRDTRTQRGRLPAQMPPHSIPMEANRRNCQKEKSAYSWGSGPAAGDGSGLHKFVVQPPRHEGELAQPFPRTSPFTRKDLEPPPTSSCLSGVRANRFSFGGREDSPHSRLRECYNIGKRSIRYDVFPFWMSSSPADGSRIVLPPHAYAQAVPPNDRLPSDSR